MPSTPMFWFVMLALVAVGAGYNEVVAKLERDGQQDLPYRGGIVALLCLLIMSLASLLVGIVDALLVTACLTAGGVPCIVGAVRRHQQREVNDKRRATELLQEAAAASATEEVAA
jgi:hypothetical protein